MVWYDIHVSLMRTYEYVKKHLYTHMSTLKDVQRKTHSCAHKHTAGGRHTGTLTHKAVAVVILLLP